MSYNTSSGFKSDIVYIYIRILKKSQRESAQQRRATPLNLLNVEYAQNKFPL